MERYLSVLIITCIILLSSCASAERDWNTAVKNNNLRGYSAFIYKHPESQYSGEAKLRIAEIEIEDWERLSAYNSRRSYRLFLKKHPGSEYSALAKKRIAELPEVDWKKALAKNTSPAYDKFIREYRDSKHVKEARLKRDQLLADGAIVEIKHTEAIDYFDYWKIRTTFLETGGKSGYRIQSGNFRIYCGAGYYYGSRSRKVFVEPNSISKTTLEFGLSKDKYKKCRYEIKWTGVDSIGNKISLKEMFHIPEN